MASLEYVTVRNDGTAGANTTVPHNTTTPIKMNLADHDPLGYWAGGTSTKLTVPAGKGGVPFLIFGSCFTNNQPAPDGYVQVRVNGSGGYGARTFIKNVSQAGGFGLQWVGMEPWVLILADGDYVELCVWQDSSGNGNASMTYENGSFGLIRLAI